METAAKWRRTQPVQHVPAKSVQPGVPMQVHAGESSRTVVHRVGLFNKQGYITTIISQSDVVRWLARHLSGLGALQHKTMQQLGWASKHIKALPARTPAIQV